MSKSLSQARGLVAAFWLLLGAPVVYAQNTAFTYQGKLTNAGVPASGAYDMQFLLFDTPNPGTGTQQGATVTNQSVQVASGIFSVELDFGGEVFDGSGRYLEIGVRTAGSPDPYTTLSPRRPISSTPYSVRSMTATAADRLSAACTNCVSSAQIESVEGTQITGAIPVESVPTGSGNYIQNAVAAARLGRPTAAQDGGFDLTGDGRVAGALSANIVNAATRYNIGGNPVLSLGSGIDNLFVGVFAGQADPSGGANSFFGTSSGFNNTTGTANSFFGRSAGFNNTSGDSNSFFGVQAGRDSSTGSQNSFFGRAAGIGNTSGLDNSYFGAFAGQAASTGSGNSFFGVQAGRDNTTGDFNAFFGRSAGISNSTGGSNSFFGGFAGFSNTTGDFNSFFGLDTGVSNTTGFDNAFFGFNSGYSNTTGNGNAFFGESAGASNTAGFKNVFVGQNAGFLSTTGSHNAFLGVAAGLSNRTGSNNTLIGDGTNVASEGLDHATAIGADSIVTASNRVQIGRNGGDTVAIGALAQPSSSTPVCVNASNVLTSCSASSRRYKENVQRLRQGLDLILRLHPVSFVWKEGHAPDLGLIAEDVAAVEPLLATHNNKGEIEGVKYSQLNVVLVNAIKEQQTQINQQQRRIDALTKLVCQSNPQADICH